MREDERHEIQMRCKKKRRSDGGWGERRRKMTNTEGMEEENKIRLWVDDKYKEDQKRKSQKVGWGRSEMRDTSQDDHKKIKKEKRQTRAIEGVGVELQ